jgi:2-polyprenyl-3-methyl-5-hydroxy-6-metoxy-1,4-benzoquinol methylase
MVFKMNCRHCSSKLEKIFVDLGFAPPSNAYLSEVDLNKPELYYPLKVMSCSKCGLVQTLDYASSSELFSSDYAYFSSTSKLWVEHARAYSEMITEKLRLDSRSMVIELASNDGYLLSNFVKKNIPCLGIEPTESTAVCAEKKGINVYKEFFGTDLAKKIIVHQGLADLIIGNNVYAHVPDINDFTKGMKDILKPNGVITLEFPHLQELISKAQFDTIYHEHYSYLSLNTVSNIFNKFGLKIWDVERLNTHGGSLRIYGCHAQDLRKISVSVQEILEGEKTFGINNPNVHHQFQLKAKRIKFEFIEFLVRSKKEGKLVVAYGAAAKGNTLLNFSGIKGDLIDCVYDAAKAKQGKFLPGSHIPILSPVALNNIQPDFIIIFPWNIASEVISQIRGQGHLKAKFITFVPEVKIID